MLLHKSWTSKAVLSFIFVSTAVAGFQNCGRVNFTTADVAGGGLTAADWCTTNPTAPECTNPSSPTCTFNGQTYNEGASVVAYLASTGTTCVSETRVCKSGAFTGSYAFASCTTTPSTPASCLFNGQTIPHGGTVTGFQTSSVAFGKTCASEVRTCNNGVLSGSYSYASCSVGTPQACLFNGQTVAHGASVVAYPNSTVAYGSTCQPTVRTCYDGQLSGAGNYATCSVGQPASCLFNGQTIPHAGTVTAFQNSSVAYGANCQSELRACNNGTLSGSYAFASCSIGTPQACLFDGKTIPHGGTVKTYQNSSVTDPNVCVSQERVCTNGSLSGNYAYSTCVNKPLAGCLFNGQTIASGGTVKAFQNSTVPYGQTCVSENRLCVNGTLNGSYNYASCMVAAPASCLFNGQTIASGQSVTAYLSATTAPGESCVSQSRLCTNGVLSGSYTYNSCVPTAPASCTFNGQTIASGQSVTAYLASTVPYGNTCSSQSRLCTNGTLSGTYTYGSCTVGQPASCLFNGQTVAHNQTVVAYASNTVPYGSTCAPINRTCSNGTLSGSGNYASCTVTAGAACTFNGQTVPHGSSVTAYSAVSVPYGQTCASQSRVCTNGTLSGSYGYGSCSVLAQKKCPGGSTQVRSGGNSAGQTNACNYSWGEMVAGTGPVQIGSSNIGGGVINISCDSNGNTAVNSSYCPAPANPVPQCGSGQAKAIPVYMTNRCPNGTTGSGGVVFVVMTLNISGSQGTSVALQPSQVKFQDSRISVSSFSGLVYTCQSNTSWEISTPAVVQATTNLSASDPGCSYTGGGGYESNTSASSAGGGGGAPGGY